MALIKHNQNTTNKTSTLEMKGFAILRSHYLAEGSQCRTSSRAWQQGLQEAKRQRRSVGCWFVPRGLLSLILIEPRATYLPILPLQSLNEENAPQVCPQANLVQAVWFKWSSLLLIHLRSVCRLILEPGVTRLYGGHPPPLVCCSPNHPLATAPRVIHSNAWFVSFAETT